MVPPGSKTHHPRIVVTKSQPTVVFDCMGLQHERESCVSGGGRVVDHASRSLTFECCERLVTVLSVLPTETSATNDIVTTEDVTLCLSLMTLRH